MSRSFMKYPTGPAHRDSNRWWKPRWQKKIRQSHAYHREDDGIPYVTQQKS